METDLSYTCLDRAMTLHLIPTSRRRFLQTTIAGGITTLADRNAAAAANQSSSRWALLADSHIAGNKETIARGVNMVDIIQDRRAGPFDQPTSLRVCVQ